MFSAHNCTGPMALAMSNSCYLASCEGVQAKLQPQEQEGLLVAPQHQARLEEGP